jgi:hypothetical protein
MTNATSTPLLQRILGWLKGGYPQGIPQNDYVALLGILHRRLTAVEVHEIAGELAAQATPGEPISEAEVSAMISTRVHESADAEAVARVSAHLAAGGWPLAGLEPTA